MAGKASKNRDREARKRIKKARKESNQLHYQQLRDQGQNKKSKRFVLRSKRTAKHDRHQHIVDNCGNHGCRACSSRKDKAHVVIHKLKVSLGLKPKQKLPPTVFVRLASSVAGGGREG